MNLNFTGLRLYLPYISNGNLDDYRFIPGVSGQPVFQTLIITINLSIVIPDKELSKSTTLTH
jgi:hypothetical protein